jgi:hypothetical protein
MKQILGTITNAATGDVVPGAIVSAGSDSTIYTTTDESGGYILQIPDNETFVNVYYIGTGTNGLTSLYIPTPFPAIWNIELQNNTLPELVIRPQDEPTTPTATVKKMWPVYAGLGLLALLLLTRKKKGRKR